jgi:hypothetical protein
VLTPVLHSQERSEMDIDATGAIVGIILDIAD